MDERYRIVRRHMVVWGDVQGVGFRHRATYAAQGLGLTGWVENAWDGTVIMEVQGTNDQIDRMLVTINRSSYIHIQRIDTKEIPLEEHEYGFHAR